MTIRSIAGALLLPVALSLSACGGGSGTPQQSSQNAEIPAQGAAQPVQQEVSFDLDLSALLEREIAPGLLNDTASNLMTGTMQVLNLATGAIELHPWTVNIDETDLSNVRSFQALTLSPGDYAFDLALNNASHSYVGSTIHTLTDAANDLVAMTIRPVIGDTQVDVITVAELIDFRFSFSQAEINSANLTNPSLGVSIGTNPEQIFVLDPTTGLTEHMLLNLTPGQYDISLRLFDSGIQVGKSVAAQEQGIVVAQGLDVTMDLIPLHGEFSLALAVEGGDAILNLEVPPEVVQEVGDIAQLQTVLSVTGPSFPLQERSLTLSPGGSGYTATTTLENVFFGELTFEMTFTDLATGGEIGYCVDSSVIDSGNALVECSLTLRRRQIASGSLLSTLGINVRDLTGAAVPGAVITIDEQQVAITNSSEFSVEGYSKIYVKPGTHTLRAQLGTASGEASYESVPLDVANIHIVLDQIDTDGDGVLDNNDACPTQPAGTPNGCPSDLPTDFVTGRVANNGGTSEIRVWFGDGAGGLTNTAQPVNPLSTHFVVAGDINDDGIDDIAVSMNTGAILVGLGPFTNGISLVQAATVNHLNNHTAPIDLADFNNDDALDLVILGYAQHRVLLGNGDGSFGTETTIPGHIGSGYGSVATADLDADGNMDFVVNTTGGAAMVEIHYGDGAGNFTSNAADNFPSMLTSDNVKIADTDTDGDLDIIVGGWGHSVKVFDNNGGRNFTEGLEIPIPSGVGTVSLLIAEDLNGDDAPDLVTATSDNPSVLQVRLNDGTGDFSNVTAYTGEVGARQAASVDINSDGIKDIAIANVSASTNSVTIMIGNGDGTFNTPFTVPGSLFTYSIASGNFD